MDSASLEGARIESKCDGSGLAARSSSPPAWTEERRRRRTPGRGLDHREIQEKLHFYHVRPKPVAPRANTRPFDEALTPPADAASAASMLTFGSDRCPYLGVGVGGGGGVGGGARKKQRGRAGGGGSTRETGER